MCTTWSIEYAQIVTNMQQLLHLCIRDVNARACLVTPVAAAVLVKPHGFTINFSLGVVTYTPSPCLDSL